MDGIDERAGRQLEDESRERADAERKADIDLAPALLGQIDGEERPEGRLHRCTEEIEAVETELRSAAGSSSEQPVINERAGQITARPDGNVCSGLMSVPAATPWSAVDTGSVADGAQQRPLRLAQLLVELDIVLRHAPRREAPVERLAHRRAVEFAKPLDRRDARVPRRGR